jgi:hypothetical protein
MDSKARRHLILQFVKDDQEFVEFSEFLAFTELSQDNQRNGSRATVNGNIPAGNLSIESRELFCQIQDIEASLAGLPVKKVGFSETDSDSFGEASSENSVIRRSSKNVLNWLAGIENNTEMAEKTNKVDAPIESRLCHHDQSYDCIELKHSYTFEGFAVDLPDKFSPVYSAQEQIMPSVQLSVTCMTSLFCDLPQSFWDLPKIEETPDIMSKSINEPGEDKSSAPICPKEDMQAQCTEISYVLERVEENELEYVEVENRIKHFKGLIGFAVLKPRK